MTPPLTFKKVTDVAFYLKKSRLTLLLLFNHYNPRKTSLLSASVHSSLLQSRQKQTNKQTQIEKDDNINNNKNRATTIKTTRNNRTKTAAYPNMFMMWPGVQKPHCVAANLPIAVCISCSCVRVEPMPSMVVISQPSHMNRGHKH